MDRKRVIGLIAFRACVSLIMLFSLVTLSQSRCLVAALGSSSSCCPSYPCLPRHFPKITFGATIKPPCLFPSPSPEKLYSRKEQSRVGEENCIWSQKALSCLCGYTALSLEQLSSEFGFQFPLSPLEGAMYMALNMRGVTNVKCATQPRTGLERERQPI